tara:strand:+ start:1667 stop:2830 length:1164 start_codon:yes stop_codon:yes gene_type:complete
MKIQNKATAIILARSGSKGIVNKNLKKISNKSLLEFSISAALKSNCVENIFVSSDSEEYLKLAESLHSKTILRPEYLSSDEASSEDGILHAIDYISQNDMHLNDYIIFLQCTSPLTTPKDIDLAFSKFLEEKYDSLFSAVNHHGFIWSKSSVKGINHSEKKLRERRQDREEELLENGSFYIFKKSKFIESKNRFFGKIGFFVQDKIKSFDIDDKFDLEINRFIYRKYFQKRDRINIKNVELIVSDFDGVFTDNYVNTIDDGTESVITSKADSLAISNFRKKHPIPFIVLTSEQNISVKKRCEKLQLPCHQIQDDKQKYLSKYLYENNISPKNVVYIGNDVNDLTCLNYVGFPVAVSDSDPALFNSSFLVLNSKGGHGAIKELLKLIK